MSDTRKTSTRNWTLQVRRRWYWGAVCLGGLACAQLLGASSGPSSPITISEPLVSATQEPLLQSLADPYGSAGTLFCDINSQGHEYSLEQLLVPSTRQEDWRDMARIADWEKAAKLIEDLPDEGRKTPGARYVLAVAAEETKQCSVALAALEGLEAELPLFSDEIKDIRASCQLEIGPYGAAVAHYEAKKTVTGLLSSARARLNAGQFDDAFWTVQRAFKLIKKQGGSAKRQLKNESRARRLRAEIALSRKEISAAARDYRWLATQATTLESAAGSAQEYERLSKRALTKQERLGRASSLANEGMLEPALAELSKLESAPGASPGEKDIVAARAWAHYHSRADYAQAAKLFHRAADLSKEDRPRFLYYAAKSHSRSHADDKAIEEYKSLAKKFPGTGYVEQAMFRIARLQYGLARFEEAETHYVAYLKRFPGGRYAKSSRYDLAVSRLALRQRTGEAELTFSKLATREGSRDKRALLTHLQGVSQEFSNRQEQAVQQYEKVIEEFPVTFAALSSAARLRSLGKLDTHRRRLHRSLATNAPTGPQLLKLPGKAKLLAAWGLHTDAERNLFEQRKQLTRRFSDKKSQAMCELYGSLDRGFRRYSLSYTFMRSKKLSRAPNADNLWAWQCAYPEPYRGIVSEVETRYRLPVSLVHAVMRQESGFRPNVVSPVGAVGLMQLMPRTARLAAQDITRRPDTVRAPDPSRPKNVRNNVELGGFYLSKLLGMLNDQMPLAIAAYNAGPSAVSRWLERGDQLPVDVWVARIPYRETRHYVSRVMGNWLAYRYLSNPSLLPRLELALVEGTRPDPDAY